MRRASSDDGFTLLELIVCLGVLSLIAIFLAEGIALVGRGRALMHRVEQNDGRRAVEAHLRQTIGQALPVFADEDGQSILAFAGAPDRMEFVIRSRREQEGGGLVRVQIGLERSGDGKLRLVATRGPWSPGSSAKGRALLEPVGGLGLRYFGRPDSTSPEEWFSVWTNRDALPALVEVSITPARDPAMENDEPHAIVIPVLGR